MRERFLSVVSLLRLVVLCSCIVATNACGGSDDTQANPLTCEVLADPTNCWAAAAGAAKACLPGAEIGVLAPDRASCTFSDGTRVVFATPLPEFVEEMERLELTIESDGATCAHFVDTFANRMELEAAGQSVVSELHPGGAFHVHCGGGPSYESDFDRLFDCAGQSVPPPTDGFDVQPGFVTFSLSSVATPGELFRCETQ